MTDFATETITRPATEQLQDHYAELIWDIDNAGPKFDDIDRLWDEELPDTLQLTQGNVGGRVRRENLAFALGSNDGLQISVDLDTPEGPRPIRLGLEGHRPRFNIRLLVEDRKPLTIEALRPDYARVDEADLASVFDFAKIMADSRAAGYIHSDESEFMIGFSSELKPDGDQAKIHYHDLQSYEAAKESPDFVEYFSGTPDKDGFSRSFCLWTSMLAARALARDPRHLEAIKATSEYKSHSWTPYFISPAGGLTEVVIPGH